MNKRQKKKLGTVYRNRMRKMLDKFIMSRNCNPKSYSLNSKITLYADCMNEKILDRFNEVAKH